MAALRNQRREDAARHIAMGLAPNRALLEAGFTPRVVKTRGHHIARDPALMLRVDELKEALRPTAQQQRDLNEAALTPTGLRKELVARLFRVMDDAEQARDRRSVIAAAAEIATLSGIRQTSVKVETDDPFKQWMQNLPAAELAAMLKGLEMVGAQLIEHQADAEDPDAEDAGGSEPDPLG